MEDRILRNWRPPHCGIGGRCALINVIVHVPGLEVLQLYIYRDLTTVRTESAPPSPQQAAHLIHVPGYRRIQLLRAGKSHVVP